MLRLKSALIECDRHYKRLKRVYGILSDFFPLQEVLDSLSDEFVEHCDQFIYRFTKLQDAIGLRVLPSIYKILENDDCSKPFLDILNRLESLSVLESVELWQYFRVLRNSFAHDYPEREEDSLEALNELYKKWPEFEAMYKKIEVVARERV